MTQEVKILILTIILIIPACLYTFLRIFGENEFSLPVYPVGEGMGSSNSEANMKSDHKMIFPDLFDNGDHLFNKESLEGVIIVLEIIGSDEIISRPEYHLNRVADAFRDENSVHLLRVIEKRNKTNPAYDHLNGKYSNVDICYSGPAGTKILTSLLFGSADKDQQMENAQLVLIDAERNIRGYYNANEFEEIDRLILEIKILLNQKANV